eukprot:SAG31_NODE_6676_length_1929_cov_2.510929_3_plen_98_part_00
MRLHHGQGLGFIVLGTVVDRRVLRNVAFAMAGGLSTGITALLALSETGDPTSNSNSHEVCGADSINAAQLAALATFRLGNQSCVYNISVNGVEIAAT